MTLEELKKLIADDEGETVKQAGTGPARPLKNGLSRHPLAFSGGICDNIRVPWG